MELTLDQVREELADIHKTLLEIPKDDFGRRSELRARQAELRQLSHQLAEGRSIHDAKTLKAAFTRLQHVRDTLLDQHLAPDSVGTTGLDAAFAAAINREIDAGSGIDEVEKRLEKILRQLRSAQ